MLVLTPLVANSRESRRGHLLLSTARRFSLLIKVATATMSRFALRIRGMAAAQRTIGLKQQTGLGMWRPRQVQFSSFLTAPLAKPTQMTFHTIRISVR